MFLSLIGLDAHFSAASKNDSKTYARSKRNSGKYIALNALATCTGIKLFRTMCFILVIEVEMAGDRSIKTEIQMDIARANDTNAGNS